MELIVSDSMTHQPLIKGVLKLYSPLFILELGIGDYSTPIFQESGVKYQGVDNSKEWINKFSGDLIFHDLQDILIGTRINEITDDQKESIKQYYRDIIIPDLNPNFLFVDNYASCRMLAINNLRDRFDLIIYHDCEPEGIDWYDYDLINTEGFNSYFLKSDFTWTGLMVRKEIDKGIELLRDSCKDFIEQFKMVQPKYQSMYL
jgi:hypothetical protein